MTTQRSKVKTVHVKTDRSAASSQRLWSCGMAKRPTGENEVFGSERREKCGRRHDGIGCGVDEPVFTCKVSKSRQLRVVSFTCKT